MSSEMKILKRDYLPEELFPLLQQTKLDGCVAVQARQTEEENTFLLSLADQHDFIKGIVGWVNLQDEKLTERLTYYKQFPKIKGFRHIIQDEADSDFMLHPKFLRGVGQLRSFGYTYDILIYPHHLPNALTLVKLFTDQPFVIDHLAKPMIRNRQMASWVVDLKKIAAHQNVYCKISGMVTEANWNQWKKEDFTPYMDCVLNAFGMNRVMFGSDWPVCKLSAEYQEVYEIAAAYFSGLSASDQNKVFGENAIRFYGL
jgi:L-fuconolactonase